jgi:heptosyltransferase III
VTSFSSFTKIFIYRGGGLGDFLAIVPLIHLLKNEDPALKITVAGPQQWLDIMHWIPTDHEIPLEKLPIWALFSENNELNHSFREFLSGFDRILWFTEPQSELGQILARTFPETIRCLQPFPGSNKAISIYVHVARILGLDTSDTTLDQLQLPLLPHPDGEISQVDRNALIWHPGSGSQAKCWPLNRALRLMKKIQKSLNERIYIVSGPAEQQAMIEEIRCEVDCEIWNDLSITELARRLRRAGIFFGNDSGISHLSALLGLKGIVMFGPSDPMTWKPFGNSIIPMHFEESIDYLEDRLVRMIIDSRA